MTRAGSEFIAAARDAEAGIRDLFEPTPLQRNAYLSARYGADIWLKREDLSPVRSCKIDTTDDALKTDLVI